jgi:hypothetical protein
MDNPLNNDDYIAGVLAATTGDLEVQLVAEGHNDSTATTYSWYWTDDARNSKCHALLVEKTKTRTNRFCESCPQDDRTAFAQAFLNTLRSGNPENDASAWFSILVDGWVDPEWISVEILKEILERGAAALQTDFDFEVWAVNGGLQNRPKRRRRK